MKRFVLVVFVLAGLIVGGSTLAWSSTDSIIKSYGRSYLKDLGHGKKLLHLEGSPYKIGYAMGYLCPDDVRRMTSEEYFMGVISGTLGTSIDLPSMMVQFGEFSVFLLTLPQVIDIPLEYVIEMQGIVDGVNAATPDDKKLTYQNVLLLNVAEDVLMSFFYKLGALGLMSSCNGFVVTGNATTDGRTLLGRNFMFSPKVFSDVALIIEYKPTNGYPFVSVNAPGFVGVNSAMNKYGVAIGMNMLAASDANYFKAGMGSLLLARKTIQYASSLDSAVTMIKNAKLGVPWMYVVGDKSGKGAVIESTAKRFAVRYLDSWYPNQIENKPDVVAVSNHAFVPEIVAVQLDGDMHHSNQRYTDMTNLILQNYGSIDVTIGREIIDFLHPGGPYSYEYGTDPDQPVACSVALYDLKAKKVWSLFGKYSDPWVDYTLPY